MKRPVFSSPMVIRPDARQKLYCLPVLLLYTVLQGWIVVRAFPDDPVGCFFSILFPVLAAWHTFCFFRKSSQDVTAFLPSVIAIGGARILYKLTVFLLQLPEITVGSVLFLILECLYWAVLVVVIIRAVCGKYKLILPLTLLLFGFFYLFIRISIRSFPELAAMICLFLLLWFPVDAVVFTSLYDGTGDRR